MNGARIVFTVLIAAVAAQRLWELRRSARHQARIVAAGGREHAPGQLLWMRGVHAAWLSGMLIESWVVQRPISPTIAAIALIAFLIGQALRLLAMRELGARWTVSIMTLPGAAPVATGIFRHMRHPNYVGVCLELAALPLIGGAYVTAVLASAANALLLVFRIRAEEAALRADNDYARTLGGLPRFFPVRVP
jgi:methyltransferase